MLRKAALIAAVCFLTASSFVVPRPANADHDDDDWREVHWGHSRWYDGHDRGWHRGWYRHHRFAGRYWYPRYYNRPGRIAIRHGRPVFWY